jgi:hypothetical protein
MTGRLGLTYCDCSDTRMNHGDEKMAYVRTRNAEASEATSASAQSHSGSFRPRSFVEKNFVRIDPQHIWTACRVGHQKTQLVIISSRSHDAHVVIQVEARRRHLQDARSVNVLRRLSHSCSDAGVYPPHPEKCQCLVRNMSGYTYQPGGVAWEKRVARITQRKGREFRPIAWRLLSTIPDRARQPLHCAPA